MIHLCVSVISVVNRVWLPRRLRSASRCPMASSGAAAMPRYDSYMSNENNLLFEISEAIRLAAEGSVSCWFCGSR